MLNVRFLAAGVVKLGTLGSDWVTKGCHKAAGGVRNRINRLYECAISTSSFLSPVKVGNGGTSGDRFGSFAADIDEAERELKDRRHAHESEMLSCCRFGMSRVASKEKRPNERSAPPFYVQGQTGACAVSSKRARRASCNTWEQLRPRWSAKVDIHAGMETFLRTALVSVCMR